MWYDITYMWNLKYDKNERICETNRLTDIENRLVVVKGLVGRRELDWEFGISRCIEWMNKILLYSTGNYIQYPVINHNEKLHTRARVHAQSLQLCLFVTLQTVVYQAPLSMGFSSQEYWNELPCPPPSDFPDPGIEPKSPASPILQVDSLPLNHQVSIYITESFCCTPETQHCKPTII